MDLADLLTPERVIFHLKAPNKKQVLLELSRFAHKQLSAQGVDLSERLIFDALLERERLGSTGIGQGIAIPHERFESLEKVYGFFASLDTAVDFDAIDEQPVDLVFLLLVPESAVADHLKALNRVSRTLRNQSVCEKLRASGDAAALYALLTDSSSSHAA